VDISIAFRASSGRHFLFLPRKGEGRDTPRVGRASLPDKQPNQSTRERWNLQYSFVQIVGPSFITFLCRKFVYCRLPIADCRFGHTTIADSQIGNRQSAIGNKNCGCPHLTEWG
jgi:hypothetical protein